MMSYAFKVLFKESYRLLKTREGRTFLKLCWKLGDKKRNTPTEVEFLKRSFKMADTWSFLWQYHEIFFRGSYAFKAQSKQPLIIDCGSNIGLSLAYFKSLYPGSKIIAFEPDTEIFAFLQHNTVSLNDIELHKKAVWKDSEGIYFEKRGSDTGCVSEGTGDLIESIRLRDLLLHYRRIDLLKMDIEGAEFAVMEDCKDALQRVDRVFVELHSYTNRKQKVSRLLEILENAGFRYFIENENDQVNPLMGDWTTGATGMDVQMNVFAIRR